MSCQGGGGIPVMSGEGYPYPVRGYSSPVQLGTPVLSCLGYPPAEPGTGPGVPPLPERDLGPEAGVPLPPKTHTCENYVRERYILPVNNPTWQKYNICLH